MCSFSCSSNSISELHCVDVQSLTILVCFHIHSCLRVEMSCVHTGAGPIGVICDITKHETTTILVQCGVNILSLKLKYSVLWNM